MLLVHEKSNNFDLIRIAMALLVVWSHSFALYWGTEANEPISLLTNGAVNAGEVAVDVFFVVSGFLIAGSYLRSNNWWSFLKKRIARIYPGYLVSVSICAFVLLPLYAGTRYTLSTVTKTVALNLLLRGWFVDSAPFVVNKGHAINGSLWSIPIEFWCYIGVLVFCLLRFRRAFLVIVFAVFIAAHVWTVANGKLWGGGVLATIFGWPNLWFRMAPFFFAGMLFFFYREVVPRSWLIAVGGLALFIVCAWRFPLAAAALLPATLAYGVFYVAFGGQFFHVAKYGDFSYGAYLYAFPIQQLLLALTKLSFPTFVGCSLVLSLLAGMASWLLVERWFIGTRASVSVPKRIVCSKNGRVFEVVKRQ